MTTLSPGRRRSGSAVPDLQRVVLLPGGAIAVLGVGTVAWLLTAEPTGTARVTVLACALALAVMALATGVSAARTAQQRLNRTARDMERCATDLAATLSHGDDHLRRTLEDLRQGRPAQPPAATVPAGGAAAATGPLAALLAQLQYSQLTAFTAVTEAAEIPAPSGAAAQQVTVLVNLARRLQSLVHQGIKILDELEQQVEDPDLLRGLFEVDHIATRIRRYVENVAVLGGEVTRRQWRKPVPLATVIRSAIGEVERYSRVKPVPPIDGRLDGAAVADVVHLLAELIENATAFSPPGTQVHVRTQKVNTGLVVEIEDRGLGQELADERMRNALLANPERVELGALLKDGRVGLYVVAVLARHHQIRVELRRNIFGGVTSLVLLPNPLLRDEEPEEAEPATAPAGVAAAPAPAAVPAAPVPAAPVPAAPVPAAAVAAPAPAADLLPPLDRRPTRSESHARTAAHAAHAVSRTAAAHVPAHAGAPAPERIPAAAPAHTPAHAAPYTPAPASYAAQPQPPAQVPSPPSDTAPAAPYAPPAPAAGRPPLPQRTQQTHMAPQLQRQAQQPDDTGQEGADYSLTPANPGLMATYRRGVRAAEEQAGRADE